MSFHMTATAAQEILAAAQRSGTVGMALRIAAKETPDGITYGMGFDEAAPQDEVAVFGGLTVLIAPPSQPWLAQTVLDFVELDGGARDFIFVPAAQSAGGGKLANLDSDRDFPEHGCGSGGCSRCG